MAVQDRDALFALLLRPRLDGRHLRSLRQDWPIMVLFSNLQLQNPDPNHGYIVGPEWAHLPILALPGLGTSVLWASMMSHATPTLLSLGMSKSSLSLVFLAGPLSGIVMQPLIGQCYFFESLMDPNSKSSKGALADASTSKYGRRRPFMIGGCLVCVPAMLGLGFARGIGELLWPTHVSGYCKVCRNCANRRYRL